MLLRIILFIFSVSIFSEALSQETIDTTTNNTKFGRVNIHETSNLDWGITSKDWQKYVDLMKGEAGLFYSHLEPSFVLGLYTDNENDIERYASIVYKQDQARTERLFRFNRALVKQGFLNPGNPFNDRLLEEYKMLKPNLANEISEIPATTNNMIGTRFVLVVKDNCNECDSLAKEMINGNQLIDIYFINSTDSNIQKWANNLKIDKLKVQNGSITLNHDSKGLFKNIGDLPLAYPLKGSSK